MSQDYKFEGWLATDPNGVGNMKWSQFEPKKFEERDVDIQISHSGICGSDLHTLRSGWGPTDYPVCVGHEIVGKAVRVGKDVKHVKVGDTVGVGAQNDSCLKPDCEACSDGRENHCAHMVGTYNAKHKTGEKSYGGYSNYHRAPGHFVFKIPDEITPSDASSMLCGGVTVYAPLKNNGCGPGKKVGIVGLGGLGHYGVLFAKALKADSVTVISRTRSKEEDAKKMGASHFIATDEDKDWASKNASSLDIIVSTVSSPKMPIQGYLNLLRPQGRFIQVGAPEDVVPGFNMFALIGKAATIGGSIIGSTQEIREMLDIAASSKLKPWIQERDMQDANNATKDMEAGKARYRYVLVNKGAAQKL